MLFNTCSEVNLILFLLNRLPRFSLCFHSIILLCMNTAVISLQNIFLSLFMIQEM